ncbi:hypothetical protein HRR83_005657 [Exophiala dermatitidis]|uniref:beta-glucosidase n=1 Tax=Exophiala dermatitidis TaxID=5970 RepID=A0AAN6ITN6_EXODE|nr:hypothetical protein HRR73_007510 [Exophiala dermatitidis]KAJ4510824.1 hypothetical protein HRR75_005518 [Exophiala dermatitidis]KAJ4513213.1 hypothetical protein HRR74_006025 [Exophiala dermatitidis]KAJ4531995.1 hypothetical protein HRR77_008957 [Exophiala dermatitidis]KAJ4539978.1 hypothetical protein HRR76_003401 [Exophiala dermatitidis]
MGENNSNQDAVPSPSPSPTFTYQNAVQEIRSGQPIAQVVDRLVSEMTDSERLSLLDGDEDFWTGFRNLFYDRFNRVPYIFGAIPRLGIPGIHFTDGPRGVVMGASTAFPVTMARGATWDTSLEERVGHAIGLEAKAQGATFYSGVCINLPRHPAWGRSQEVYGEDPILLGEFGLALTRGVQRHIMACVKHFALNSMENARFKVDVEVDDDVLHEVYLPHFRRVVEGGVASVMSSYNSVNGEWAGQNKHLLTDILRNTWGFDGFVISDFIWGLRDAVASVKAGLDIETPFKQQRHLHLPHALESGDLEWSAVNSICTRILRKQLQFHETLDKDKPDMDVVFSEEHRTLARYVAARSAVLLKNEPVDGKPLLPIDPSKITKIALVGRLADIPNTGDRGSSHVWSPHVVTIYEGVKSTFSHAEIILVEDTDINSPEAVSKAASIADADLVLCIVGYTEKDEGEYAAPTLMKDPALRATFPPATTKEEIEVLNFLENAAPREKDINKSKSDDAWKAGAGGDRQSLRLRPQDVETIHAVSQANPRTIVSVVCGGAVILDQEWKNKVPALLMSWYAGCEGGHGLMDVLTGKIPPSGRLPFSIPKDESHLPHFDIDAETIKYDRWFGQALLDKLGVEAAYPLGFGLSYTTFQVDNLRFDLARLKSNRNDIDADADANANGTDTETHRDADTLTVYATVKNTDAYPGRYIAQVYGCPCPNIADFPKRLLLGFNHVDLDIAESKDIEVIASIRPLQQWRDGQYRLRCDKVEIELASFAGDPMALRDTCYLQTHYGSRNGPHL